MRKKPLPSLGKDLPAVMRFLQECTKRFADGELTAGQLEVVTKAASAQIRAIREHAKDSELTELRGLLAQAQNLRKSGERKAAATRQRRSDVH